MYIYAYGWWVIPVVFFLLVGLFTTIGWLFKGKKDTE